MSAELIGILGIILVLLLIAMKFWIGAAMGIVGFLGLVVLRGLNQALTQVGSIPFQNINSYTMTVIPMFTLMGMVISETDIGKDLFVAAHKWLGHLRGGLASASIVASGLLGAICGSHTTGTVIMSKIALPEMTRYKYDLRLSTGSIAAGAPLSIIIPPSLPMVLYGIMTEQSIGKLFISGIIPGIIMMIVYIIVITVLCRLNPEMGPADKRASFRERIASLKGIWAMLALFLLVLGGIYGGFFTPTESGAIGAFGAIIIGFIKRELNIKKLLKCIKDTAVLTAMILFIIAGTYVFISFITYSKLPFLLSSFIASLNVPTVVILIAIAIMYIILGCFLPEYPMIILTIPIIFPAVTALGVDPIWFGLFTVLMMSMGALSPPVGLVVYILGACSGVPVATVFRGTIPFLLADVFIIILVLLFPQIVTFLPGLMG